VLRDLIAGHLARGLMLPRRKIKDLRAIFGVTLPAQRQFGICLACAFQDGWPSGYRLVSAQDHIDVKRVEFEAAAASASLRQR
jgi:hypothetical protein